MKLSLVIPCYNEAANLPLLVPRCLAIANAADLEVVLVDNGSTDDTQRIMAELLAGQEKVRSVRVEVNRGYGYGIVAGLRAARGDILAWTHADMQTDPADVIKGLDIFARSPRPDRLFVKGRRFGRPFGDVVFTFGMSVFETILLRTGLSDINAQPTMMPKSVLQSWKTPPDDFSLDLFAYYSARQAGMDVVRFPVLFGKRAHGFSHWNVNWHAKAKFIRRTMTYSFKLRREFGSRPPKEEHK